MFRRSILKLLGGMVALPVTLSTSVFAGDMPAPFDNPGDVKIALVRYLSTGDFFQAWKKSPVERYLTSAIFTSPGLSNGAGISPANTEVERVTGNATIPPNNFNIDLLNIVFLPSLF